MAAAHHRREAGDLGGALEAYLAAARYLRTGSRRTPRRRRCSGRPPSCGHRSRTPSPARHHPLRRLRTGDLGVYQTTADLEESQRLVDAAIEALPPDASRHRRAMLRLLWRRMRWHDNPGVTTADVLATVTEVEMDPPSADAAMACLTAAEALLQSGEAPRAEQYARRAVETAETIGDEETLVFCLASLGDALACQGEHRDALPLAERAVDVADRTGDVFAQVYALSGLEFVLWLAGESTLELAERLVELLGGERPGPLRGRWVGAQVDVAESLIDVGQVGRGAGRAGDESWPSRCRTPCPGGAPVARSPLDLARRRATCRVRGTPSVTQRTPPWTTPGSTRLLLARYTDSDIAARSGDLLAARAHASAAIRDDRVVTTAGSCSRLLLVAARVEADLAVAGEGSGAGRRASGSATGSGTSWHLAPPGNPRDQAYAEHVRAELDTPRRSRHADDLGGGGRPWRTTSRPFQLAAALVRYGEACGPPGRAPKRGSLCARPCRSACSSGARPLVEEALAVSRKAHLRLTADLTVRRPGSG